MSLKTDTCALSIFTVLYGEAVGNAVRGEWKSNLSAKFCVVRSQRLKIKNTKLESQTDSATGGFVRLASLLTLHLAFS